MTKEEIIQGLYKGDSRAIKEAIKALEQPTSDDCVSRESVKKWLHQHVTINLPFLEKEMFEQMEKDLSPVTPTRKVGKWIRKPIRNEKGGCIGAEMICSYCKKDNEQDKKLAYCPNCGAEMRGNKDGI